jgi:hypothetical protein
MADDLTHWPAPAPGDVVWCRFPEALTKPAPAPKPRPGIVIQAFAPQQEGAPCVVHVCPGTSQIKGVYDHELLIDRDQAEEFAAAGLSYPTKFDLKRVASLPYTSEWFCPPPNPRFGAIPKLGTLHPATVPRLRACHKAGQR